MGELKTARGRRELEAYRQGKKLTYRQACLAKCYECMGGYADGKVDCEIPGCPLYGFMPFKAVEARKIAQLAGKPGLDEER